MMWKLIKKLEAVFTPWHVSNLAELGKSLREIDIGLPDKKLFNKNPEKKKKKKQKSIIGNQWAKRAPGTDTPKLYIWVFFFLFY